MWWRAEEEGYVQARRPDVSWKINLLADARGVAAVQLAQAKNNQKDVELFLLAALKDMRKTAKNAPLPIVVLDNGPKNRGVGMFKLARKNLCKLLFITPGCPQHNMAEHFFLRIKKNFAKFEHLAHINASMNPVLRTGIAFLDSITSISSAECQKIVAQYFHEASQILDKHAQCLDTL